MALNFKTDRRRRPPVSFLGRREQRRLLVLVMMIGLVVIMMGEASKPENWEWLLGQSQPQPGQRGEIDNRVAPRARPAVDDAIIAEAPKARVALAPSDDWLAGVDPQLLADIEDNTPFRAAEHAAFFHLLNLLNETSEEQIAEAAQPVTYVQLFEQANTYRGELVTLKGIVRWAHEIEAVPNEYGLEYYYQVWLEPDDQPEPVCFYVLDLPLNFPLGQELGEKVTLHGVFFKRWVYRARQDMRITPLLLARTLHWEGTATIAQAEKPAPGASFPVALAIAAALAVLFISFVILRSRAMVSPAVVDASVPKLNQLERAELAPSPEEHLRRLADQRLGSEHGMSAAEPPHGV